MTAGPAPLTPVPMVVKIPPPIIVPSPIAIKSLPVRIRRRIFPLLSWRSFSTELVAKRRWVNDIPARFAEAAGTPYVASGGRLDEFQMCSGRSIAALIQRDQTKSASESRFM